MAITITSQPTANKFFSSEYPLIIEATSTNADIKYIRFNINDHNTTGLGIPSYYAPKINNKFIFNVTDYLNNYLTIIRDDLVSFDATPTVHVYDNLSQDVQIDLREIETDGTTAAQAQSNNFYVCKFKHQLYNANGTAEEYIDNRYFLTTLPYSRSTAQGYPAYFYHRDGRRTINILNEFSRACFFSRVANTDNFVAIAYDEDGGEIARCTIDLSTLTTNAILGIPMGVSDLNTLSTTSGEDGWVDGVTPVAVQDILDDYVYVDAVITDLQDQSTAFMRFFVENSNTPIQERLKCPTTFIYMNRFGVHEVLTLHTKTNEAVVSSRDNATLVNTNPFGAHSNDLGAYLLTGARQRAVNPRSEFEFSVNNTLPYTKEQNREIMLDFFASPVHYVVDVVTDFQTDFDIEHPDTGFKRVRRISINDGKVDATKNNRAQKLQFTYRYADKL